MGTTDLTLFHELASPQYKSKTEKYWGDVVGSAIVADALGATVMLQLYEPIALRYAGNYYTPDFFYILDDGRGVFVEIKGSKKARGYRETRSKLRACAKTYGWWTFCEAVGGERNGYEFEVIKS